MLLIQTSWEMAFVGTSPTLKMLSVPASTWLPTGFFSRGARRSCLWCKSVTGLKLHDRSVGDACGGVTTETIWPYYDIGLWEEIVMKPWTWQKSSLFFRLAMVPANARPAAGVGAHTLVRCSQSCSKKREHTGRNRGNPQEEEHGADVIRRSVRAGEMLVWY